jgi:hypothetical protein
MLRNAKELHGFTIRATFILTTRPGLSATSSWKPETGWSGAW